eukprot:4797545-Amphidinium_carterae.1
MASNASCFLFLSLQDLTLVVALGFVPSQPQQLHEEANFQISSNHLRQSKDTSLLDLAPDQHNTTQSSQPGLNSLRSGVSGILTPPFSMSSGTEKLWGLWRPSTLTMMPTTIAQRTHLLTSTRTPRGAPGIETGWGQGRTPSHNKGLP